MSSQNNHNETESDYEKLTNFLKWILQRWEINEKSFLETGYPDSVSNMWALIPQTLKVNKQLKSFSEMHSIHLFIEECLAEFMPNNKTKAGWQIERLLKFSIAKLRSCCKTCILEDQKLPADAVNMTALISPCPLTKAFELSLIGVVDTNGSPSPAKVAEQRYRYMGPSMEGFESYRKDVYNQYPKTRLFSSWPHLYEDPKMKFDGSRVFLHGRKYIAHWHPGAPTAVRTGFGVKLENTFNLGDYYVQLLKDDVRVIVCLSEPKMRRNYIEPIYWETQSVKAATGEIVNVELLEEKHYRSAAEITELEFISIRTLKVEIKAHLTESTQTAIIKQCHYRNWQDGSIPFHLPMFKRFMELVTSCHDNCDIVDSPIAVHCSAGWGRSGIFIWCHSITYRRAKEDQINGDTPVYLTAPPPPAELSVILTWRKLLFQREMIQNPFQFAFCVAWTHAAAESGKLEEDYINVVITDEFIQSCRRLGASWVSEDSNSPSWRPQVKEKWKKWFEGAKGLDDDYVRFVWQTQLEKAVSNEDLERILTIPLKDFDFSILQDLLTYDTSKEREEGRKRLKEVTSTQTG